MRQLGSDITSADVDGDVCRRVAADGDTAECARLVLSIDEVVGEELGRLAIKVCLVVVQNYNTNNWSYTATNRNNNFDAILGTLYSCKLQQ